MSHYHTVLTCNIAIALFSYQREVIVLSVLSPKTQLEKNVQMSGLY